jgi:TonB family protein
MFPEPMSRSEIRPDVSPSDPTGTLEEHIRAGFPPDLALDLVLNELVVRAAEATRASAAALALVRGDEMVCRAATGNLAPDLGVPLNTRDGLSGACLQTRQPQLSVDTEFDPRVDPAISRRLGIRSILIVPVFDSNDKNARFTGVLEVFSTSPAAFSHNDQKILEDFAEECGRIRQAAIELSQRKRAVAPVTPELIPPDFAAPVALSVIRPPHEAWTLLLGGLSIAAIIAVSFLIGFRVGWLSPSRTAHKISTPLEAPATPCVGTPAPGCPAEQSSATSAAARGAIPSSLAKTAAQNQTPHADELVVYEKGKVIFRMKPVQASNSQSAPDAAKRGPTQQGSNAIVEASSNTRLGAAQSVWLAAPQAETLLLSRTEPQYPPEALAAHRAGNVVLEVQVAENGSISSIRTLSGDPILATAATEAVRTWRYKPHRQHDRPTRFQTDVTLSFTLPQ